MLLIIVLLVVFISYFVFVIIPGLLHLLLHVRGENWIFRQNFFFCHLKTLEQKIRLRLRDLVLVFLGQVLSCLELKVLLVLALCLANVVLK